MTQHHQAEFSFPDTSIGIGDKVRSYDFVVPTLEEDCYVEGVVQNIIESHGAKRYVIRCTRRVYCGQEIPPEDSHFIPVINGTKNKSGETSKHVVRVAYPTIQ